jgi:ABC-type sugar transport system, permease component
LRWRKPPISTAQAGCARYGGSSSRKVRGGIAVTIVFVFLNAWNEFLFAVVLSGNTVRPVTVAMFNFVSVEQTLWAKLAAVSVLAMLPVVILGIIAQKNIVKGLTVGAVKGGGRR